MTTLHKRKQRVQGYVDTVAALRLMDAEDCFGRMETLGYAARGDGGGHAWFWDAASTATDNNGTVARPAHVAVGDPGRWLNLCEEFHIAHFGFLGGNTGAQNTAVWVSTYPLMPAGKIYFPEDECLVAGQGGAVLSESALSLKSNTVLVAPRLKLAANSPTSCRMFVSCAPGVTTPSAATLVSNVLIEGGRLDGNRANQPVTEQQHAIFCMWATKVVARGVEFLDFKGDCMQTYNGTLECGIEDCWTSGVMERSGLTAAVDSSALGDNVRSFARRNNFKVVAQPIDIEPDSSGTASNVIDWEATDNYLEVVTDGAHGDPTCIGVSGSRKIVTGEARGNTCVNGGIYANYSRSRFDGNRIRIGIELSAVLNSTTAVTGLSSVRGDERPTVGMLVFGQGIAAGCTLTAVDMVAGTATLSIAATVTGTVVLGAVMYQTNSALECVRWGDYTATNNTIDICVPTVSGNIIYIGQGGGERTGRGVVSGNKVRWPLATGQVLFASQAIDLLVDDNTFDAPNMTASQWAVNVGMNVSPTITGTLTAGSPTVAVASSAQIFPDMDVTGMGIPANAVVFDVPNATSFRIAAGGVLVNATAGGAQTLTVGNPRRWVFTNNRVRSASGLGNVLFTRGADATVSGAFTVVGNDVRGGLRGLCTIDHMSATTTWTQHSNTFDGVAIPEQHLGGALLATRRIGGTETDVAIFQGAGTPEGVVAAPVGSRYFRTDGVGATTEYGKQTGTGNTGWVASGPPLTGTATFDPPSLAAGARTTTTVTVTGAALGDTVDVSFSLDTQGIRLYGWVSLADTVTVELSNPTAAAINLASGTLRAKVQAA